MEVEWTQPQPRSLVHFLLCNGIKTTCFIVQADLADCKYSFETKLPLLKRKRLSLPVIATQLP